MTVTLDGKTLNVTRWSESVQTLSSQWDAWVSGVYKRKVRVFGALRTYNIECVEYNVNWADSQVKHFEQVAANGNPVVFYSNEALRPVDNVNVYVLNVSWTEEKIGDQNIRKFTLTLQEA